MKLASLLALALLISCRADVEEAQGPGGEFRRFEPVTVAPEEFSRIKEICDALASKEEKLPVLINSTYTFSYSQRGCNEAAMSAAADVKVRLQRPDSTYVFRKENGDAFDFSNVETTSSGVMSAICSSLADLRSPLQTSSKGAVWFTTFNRTSICASDFNSICIHLQRGEYVDNASYSIHTNEWIKFKIMDAQRGFFVERKIVSNAACPAGKTFEKSAVLK